MTILARRIAYVSAFIIFATAAPLLIYFAQGYRFDLTNRTVYQVGGLRIRQLPPGSEITLNGKPIVTSSPTTELSLRPGQYELFVSAEGFQPWSDRIRVASESITVAHPTLIPNSPARVSIAYPTTEFVALHDQSGQLAISSGSQNDCQVETHSFRSAEALQRFILSGIGQPVSMEWSRNGRRLALRDSVGRIAVLQTDLTALVPVNLPPDVAVEQLAWSTDSDSILYARASGQLWQIDLFTSSASVLASPGVLDVKTVNSQLWVIRDDPTSGQRSIEQLGLQTPNTVLQRQPALPGTVRILTVIDRRAVTSNDRGLVEVWEEGQLMASLGPFNRLPSWIPQPNGLNALVAGDSQAIIYHLKNNTQTLVYRGIGFRSAAWYPDGNSVLIATDQTIEVVNIESRGASSGRLTSRTDILQTDLWQERLILAGKNGYDLIELR